MQARPHCPNSTTENLGRLHITHLVQITEHNYFAITFGQSQHGSADCLYGLRARQVLQWATASSRKRLSRGSVLRRFVHRGVKTLSLQASQDVMASNSH